MLQYLLIVETIDDDQVQSDDRETANSEVKNSECTHTVVTSDDSRNTTNGVATDENDDPVSDNNKQRKNMDEQTVTSPLSELQQTLSNIDDRNVTLSDRCSNIYEQIDNEKQKLSATPLKDYDRMDCVKYVTKRTEILFGEIEAQMLSWNIELGRLREGLGSISKLVDKKLLNEGLPSWIDDLKTDPTGMHISSVDVPFTVFYKSFLITYHADHFEHTNPAHGKSALVQH